MALCECGVVPIICNTQASRLVTPPKLWRGHVSRAWHSLAACTEIEVPDVGRARRYPRANKLHLGRSSLVSHGRFYDSANRDDSQTQRPDPARASPEGQEARGAAP